MATAGVAAQLPSWAIGDPAGVCGEGVRTLLGTMSYSAQTAAPDAEAQIRAFVEAGFVELDSARMYAKGGSEELLGAVLGGAAADVKGRITLATKANPFPGYGESLSAESVARQLDASLAAMGVVRLPPPSPDPCGRNGQRWAAPLCTTFWFAS